MKGSARMVQLLAHSPSLPPTDMAVMGTAEGGSSQLRGFEKESVSHLTSRSGRVTEAFASDKSDGSTGDGSQAPLTSLTSSVSMKGIRPG